jgi:hypothetical protein
MLLPGQEPARALCVSDGYDWTFQLPWPARLSLASLHVPAR